MTSTRRVGGTPLSNVPVSITVLKRENLLNSQYFPAYAQAVKDPSDFYAGQGARLYIAHRIRY